MVDRRQMLINNILSGLKRAVAEHPEINWEASGLDIDLAEHAFEEKAAEFLSGKVGLNDVKPLFRARTEAYIQAS